MKLISTILVLALSCLTGQDRSLIFSTGSPSGTEGYSIQWDGTSGQSVSDRIHISGNMVLEALKIYAVADTEPAMARVLLQADNGGIPGEEFYSWEVDVSAETHGNNYFLIITTDLCIYLDEGNDYWLTLHAADTASQITWLYSNNATFTYNTSTDQGENWETATTGNCGSLSVWAEYIYEPEVDEVIGDINEDGGVNVLDVVSLVDAILNAIDIDNGDINGDNTVNVIDVVMLVNMILS